MNEITGVGGRREKNEMMTGDSKKHTDNTARRGENDHNHES